ncbi:MAG: ABC-F family ATP-binding cassette domain-containing protein [Pseudomonadota bacterium]
MLHVNDLTYRIAGRTLFESATMAIPAGTKAGLVGRNGTGKSTLFRLLKDDIAPESGSVSIQKGARIGEVAQEAPGTDVSLIDTVLAADRERLTLLEEAQTATDPNRIAEIQLRLADIGAHSAEARAAAILHGLGFDAKQQAQPCAAFSGGWRMRVALAAVLFSEPDLLLLDEPTNYLDLEGTIWLENYINRYPYTVFLISHDRDLLNRCVSTIVHLDQAKLTVYRGGYDIFDRQRRERQALQLKLKAKQEDQRRHMEAFVERFRAKATKAKQAQSRLKALQRMEPIAAMVDEKVKPFRFPNPQKQLSPPIIHIDEGAVGYQPDQPVLNKVGLSLNPDDRIGLLGANGNGKSTLAKLLSGRLKIQSGRMKAHHNMQIAYFAQHQLDELRPNESAYDHVRAMMENGSDNVTEAQARARTAQIGLDASKMDTPAKNLSGGERARLLLGLATFNGAHLIILDEPTNHLDIDSREALVHALNEYEGAVIMISHDRHLIEASADRLWLVADGTVKPYEGDLDEYRAYILQTKKAQQKTGNEKKPDANRVNSSANAAERRREAAEKRAEIAPLRAEIKTLEKTISVLQKKIALADEKMAIPNLFTDHPEKATELAKIRARLARELEDAEEAWLEKSEALEEAGA